MEIHQRDSPDPVKFRECRNHLSLCVNVQLIPFFTHNRTENLHHLYSSEELLSFFMGKNTPERQEFIIENLRVEKDLVEV